MPKPPSNKLIKKALRFVNDSHGEEGVIEVDTDIPATELNAAISECEDWVGEGGFYVKAWVWVDLSDLKGIA